MPPATNPISGTPPPTSPTAAASELHRESSHGAPIHTGGSPSVTLESPTIPPVTGMNMIPSPFPSPLSSQVLASLGQPPPSMTFPMFIGENPQLWKTLCEQYFQMFTVHESYWVPMAILNFLGPAWIWLQSVQCKIAGLTWESFTALMCTPFGWDKHQLIIRQFYAIRQTSSVADFIECFETLMNHLITYSELTHPYFFPHTICRGAPSGYTCGGAHPMPTEPRHSLLAGSTSGGGSRRRGRSSRVVHSWSLAYSMIHCAHQFDIDIISSPTYGTKLHF